MSRDPNVFGMYNVFPDAELAVYTGAQDVFSPFAPMDAIRRALETRGRTVFAWLTIESWPAFFTAPALAPGDGVLFAFTFTTRVHDPEEDARLDAQVDTALQGIDEDDDDAIDAALASLDDDDEDDEPPPTLAEHAAVAWLNKERECIVFLGEHSSTRAARGDDVSDLEGDEDRPTNHDDDEDQDDDDDARLGGLRA